ncbi:MAG: retropepsin-like domain-containing protein [Parvularculaceae bacterium]|nr:retropepsin-like domain-containing protein [Parvularculaceae bacterium]
MPSSSIDARAAPSRSVRLVSVRTPIWRFPGASASCHDCRHDYITNRNKLPGVICMRLSSLMIGVFAIAFVSEAKAGAPSARLDFSSGRTVVVATTDKGGEKSFILDTGSQGATILKSVADATQYEVIGEALLGSPGGGKPLKSVVVSLGGLAISGVRATENAAVIVDDQVLPIGSAVGALGPTQWRNHVVEMDLGADVVSFRKKPKRKPTVWAPLNQRGLTESEIEVAGQKLSAHLDTGNPRGALLPLSVARQLGWADALKPAGEIRTVDKAIPIFSSGRDVTANVLGQSIVLKAVKFADAPFVNIGAEALKGQVIIIDNPNKRWGLRKSAARAK